MNESGTPPTGNPLDLPLEQQGLPAERCANPARRHLEIQVRGSALGAGIVDTGSDRTGG